MNILSSIGAKKSAKSQERAGKRARAEFQGLHDEGKAVRKQIDSWSTVGRGENGETGVESAGSELYSLLFGDGQYDMSPAAKFASAQGNKAINRKASASGMRNSGNVLHEMGEYTTGVASQDYWANINNLMQLSGASNMLGAAQLQLNTSAVAVQGKAAANIQIGQAQAAQHEATFSGLESFNDKFSGGKWRDIFGSKS